MSTPSELARQAEQLSEPQWYEFLDALDDVSRRRAQSDVPDHPQSNSRVDVAAWIARKHFIADRSIREIWFLPANAAETEIRLLEVNDEGGRREQRIEALDFGLALGDVRYTLSVADASSEQLADAQSQAASLLPSGWSWEGSQVWRRRP